MAFFVELSQDEYGSRLYTNRCVCVLEADLKEDESGIQRLHVIAPDEIRGERPTIRLFPDCGRLHGGNLQGDFIRNSSFQRQVSKGGREWMIGTMTRLILILAGNGAA